MATRPTGTKLKIKPSLASETINSIVNPTTIEASKKTYTTTIRLPEDIKNKITLHASKRGLTNSAFIKLAISSLIEELEKE